jgi:8-oxo-dGTP pyrophosphatase MutT (NUDIX family)
VPPVTADRRGEWTTSDLKALVLDEVAVRTPVDELEARDIARFVADIAPLADPFAREAGPAHVTGSGLVVGPRGILLLRHLKLHLWVQPGGHVDAGETPWDGARREVLEETGLAVEPVEPDGRPELAHVSVHPAGDHVHYDLRYLFTGGDADPAPPEGESQDVHWFDWPGALAIAEPALAGILRSLHARFPLDP